MIGWFINCEIFQKYQSPSLASAFVVVVVVVVVGGGGALSLLRLLQLLLLLFMIILYRRGVWESAGSELEE